MKRFYSLPLSSVSFCRSGKYAVASRQAHAVAATEAAPSPAPVPPKEKLGILQISRFDPFTNSQQLESFTFTKKNDYMVLDLLVAVKAHQDPSLAFRASCCEGVCGSCAMNINGINSLACITYATDVTTVAPLPNMPVIKDLVVDFRHFFSQYSYIRPFVRNVNLARYHIQNIYERYLSALVVKKNAMTPKSFDLTDGVQYTHIPLKLSLYFSLLDRLIVTKQLGKAILILQRIASEAGHFFPSERMDALVKDVVTKIAEKSSTA